MAQRSASPSTAIDIQTHYIPATAWHLIEHTPVAGVSKKLAPDHPILSLEERLVAMDAHAIGTSLLSFAPIDIVEDAARRKAICDAANDGLRDACLRFPDRFVMAATLPFPDANAAYAELKRLADLPMLRAITIIAQTTEYAPEHGFDAVFGLAADLGLPVILHPSAGVADLSPAFDIYGLSSGMHAMISHALVAARMAQSGMLDRIPNLELILTHLGGILPSLIDRIDSRHRGTTQHLPSHYFKTRMWYDTCGVPAGPALRCAIDSFGEDRLMIGSDWPSRPIAPVIEALSAQGLSKAAQRAILHDNAARWFDPACPRRTS